MQFLVALLLLGLALFLYFAKRLLPNDKLDRLANAVAVASLVAAALVFLVPVANTSSQLPNTEAPAANSTVSRVTAAPSLAVAAAISPTASLQAAPRSPTSSPYPSVYLEYPLAMPLAIGPGSVDLLRLHNNADKPLSVVSYGAEFVFARDTIVVLCEKDGLCLDSAPLPVGVLALTVSITPDRVLFVGKGTPTADPFLTYPLLIEVGATDFIAKAAIVLPVDHEPFTERVLFAPFLVTSLGERIQAPYTLAVTIP